MNGDVTVQLRRSYTILCSQECHLWCLAVFQGITKNHCFDGGGGCFRLKNRFQKIIKRNQLCLSDTSLFHGPHLIVDVDTFGRYFNAKKLTNEDLTMLLISKLFLRKTNNQVLI